MCQAMAHTSHENNRSDKIPRVRGRVQSQRLAGSSNSTFENDRIRFVKEIRQDTHTQIGRPGATVDPRPAPPFLPLPKETVRF